MSGWWVSLNGKYIIGLYSYLYIGGINYLFTHHWSDPPSNSGVKPVSPDIFVCSNSQGVLLEKHQLWCKTSIFQCGKLFTSKRWYVIRVCFRFGFLCLHHLFTLYRYIIYIYINPNQLTSRFRKDSNNNKKHMGSRRVYSCLLNYLENFKLFKGYGKWRAVFVCVSMKIRWGAQEPWRHGELRQWGEGKEKNEKKGVCPGSVKLVVGSLGLESWKMKIVFVNLLDSWYSIKWLEEKKHYKTKGDGERNSGRSRSQAAMEHFFGGPQNPGGFARWSAWESWLGIAQSFGVVLVGGRRGPKIGTTFVTSKGFYFICINTWIT